MKADRPRVNGEPAMKIRIGAMTGAMTVMALLAIGDAGMIGPASAAKVISVPRTHLAPQRTQLSPARTQRAYQDRYGYGPYDTSRYDRSRYDHSPYDYSPYDRPYGGWSYYVGRPYYYAPAPFPLGFDFGFGW
jgi:hypothetical protein